MQGLLEEQSCVVWIRIAGRTQPGCSCIFQIAAPASRSGAVRSSRREICGPTGCRWLWTLGNCQGPSLPIRFLRIRWTLTSGSYAGPSVCRVALGTSRSEMLSGDSGQDTSHPSRTSSLMGEGGQWFLRREKTICNVSYAIWRDKNNIHLQWYLSPEIVAKGWN